MFMTLPGVQLVKKEKKTENKAQENKIEIKII